jgi:hypothetical protein
MGSAFLPGQRSPGELVTEAGSSMRNDDDERVLREADGARRQGTRFLPETETAGSATAGPSTPRSAAPRPLLLELAPHQARDLPRWIPHLIQHVRGRLPGSGNAPPAVVIDLSGVPPTPACAPFLLLFRLVRRLSGSRSPVVVTGVNAALCACLVAGLPAGVMVIDQRGRRWSR